MSTVFCWGSSQHGQLGLGSRVEDIVSLPVENPTLKGKKVRDISCGERHSLIGLFSGHLFSCGNNDHGQLGHEKGTQRLEQIESLDSKNVVQTCAGKDYSLCLTSAGEVFSWGSNQQGQLGRGNVELALQGVPKLIKQLVPHHVVQISGGSEHCLALTKDGQLFCWGGNYHGQLGLGNNGGCQNLPNLITSLRGIPVKHISTGSSHSFLLTVSGALFGWGKNSFGQLGVNDEKDRHYPTLCKSLRQQKVDYVECGDDHTAVLTEDGGVFTFGAAGYGQLGHNSTQNEILPKKVVELMGSNVSQIACGRRHSLVYIESSGKVYSFGLGGSGQLGIENTKSVLSPTPVKYYFLPYKDAMEVDDTSDSYIVDRIFAGGDHCFVSGFKQQNGCKPADYRIFSPEYQISFLVPEIIQKICELPADGKPPTEFSNDVQRIFSSASCLNSSFLSCGKSHYGCTPHHHGLDMDLVYEQMNRLGHAKNIIMIQKICQSIEESLLQVLPASPPDVEAMRLYLILPYFHLFDQPKYYSSLIGPFGRSILNLDKQASKVLDYWLASIKPHYFSRIVYIYKQCIAYVLQLPSANSPREYEKRMAVLFISMQILKKMNGVNEGNSQIIPYHKFYVAEIQDKIDLRRDYISWVTKQKFTDLPFSLCDYPFLFDAVAKSVLLNTDASLQMRTAVDEVNRQNLMGLFMPIDPAMPYLVLYVSRENLVYDTLQQIIKYGPQDLKKPMKVKFQGEDAVDEGGVQKEFFLLLLREVLDPKYGMFRSYEESHLEWFSSQSFEDSGMFHLIGCLCGLAIYNTIIIQLNFPLALYKKLLKKKPTLDDIKELIPTVGRSLEDLLNYEEDDIQDAFCLTFQVGPPCLGFRQPGFLWWTIHGRCPTFRPHHCPSPACLPLSTPLLVDIGHQIALCNEAPPPTN
ncbi:hypothetical protein ScPMuIL_003717 [Solemya velum]